MQNTGENAMLTAAGAKEKLIGEWKTDVDMLAKLCDGLKSCEYEDARSELRRMIIRVMEYELLYPPHDAETHEKHLDDYTEYVLDSGSMPVSREALLLFIEQIEKGLKGDVNAAFLLGTGYLSGIFGRISYRFTHLWYRVAAEGNHAQAIFNLGVCYQNGEGVEQSYEHALELFERSAALGYDKGVINVGIYNSNGWGCPGGRDHAKARVQYEKAAADGNADAMYHLALCYLKGEGGAADPELALKWIQASADAGCEQARDLLARASQGGGDLH